MGNHMKIKDYQNYDSLREYYGVLNGQNPNTGISPRAPTFSGLANPTKILDNIKTQRGKLAPSTPLPRGPNPATAKGASKQLQFERSCAKFCEDDQSDLLTDVVIKNTTSLSSAD